MNPSPSPERLVPLRDALQSAANDLACHQPPPQLPAAAWAALASRGTRRHRAPRRFAWAGGGLAAATLAAAALILTTAPHDERPAPQAALATPFMPVGGGERWNALMRESRDHGPAWVVTTELPRASMAALGLPVDPSRAGESVRAELLLHASGDVLAVRFVR